MNGHSFAQRSTTSLVPVRPRLPPPTRSYTVPRVHAAMDHSLPAVPNGDKALETLAVLAAKGGLLGLGSSRVQLTLFTWPQSARTSR